MLGSDYMMQGNPGRLPKMECRMQSRHLLTSGMKPEILLKAYLQYQSEDAFRELVAGSLDEVYSTALRIVEGPQHKR
jgi:hypothetical protein